MRMSNRAALAVAALNGLLGVALSAYAVHGISAPDARELVRTGALFQLLHGAGGAAAASYSPISSLAMGLGALLFGLSLYALAMGGVKFLGPVTPIGGLLMIAGWFVLMVTALRPRSNKL